MKGVKSGVHLELSEPIVYSTFAPTLSAYVVIASKGVMRYVGGRLALPPPE